MTSSPAVWVAASEPYPGALSGTHGTRQEKIEKALAYQVWQPGLVEDGELRRQQHDGRGRALVAQAAAADVVAALRIAHLLVQLHCREYRECFHSLLQLTLL